MLFSSDTSQNSLMQRDTQNLYVGEIRTQAELAAYAGLDINRYLAVLADRDSPIGPRSEAISQVFRSIHSLLTHASNISKLFWPVGADGDVPPTNATKLKRWQRGQYLRSLFNITSPNALEKRTLRDHLEHFDERLDKLAEAREVSTTGKTVVDLVIGPRFTPEQGLRPDFVLRHFSKLEEKVIFQGEDYDFRAIDDAVGEVLGRARQLLG
jgi:hypothetical protein